jgi:predicted methyltransferase
MTKTKLMLGAMAVAALLSTGTAYAKPDANHMAAVADKGRPDADSKRDADRKPAEMLEFAGVKPGQTVVDLIPGGGYFTRIFSKAVGPKGTVYAVGGPPRPSTDPAKPAPTPPADLIAADPAYANVKSLHAALAGGLAIPTKADLVWTAQNYHDVKNVPNIDMLKFDKAASAGTAADPTDKLHRIDPAIVRKEVEAAGFKFEGESKLLANPADDHTKTVFDAAIRGHTDQFIYKFRKPK